MDLVSPSSPAACVLMRDKSSGCLLMAMTTLERNSDIDTLVCRSIGPYEGFARAFAHELFVELASLARNDVWG